MGGARILTDPVLRDRVLYIRRLSGSPAPEVEQGVDAALISHLHPDHLDPASLRRLGRETMILAPLGARRMLRRRGFKNVFELAPGDAANVGEAKVSAIAVHHDGRRFPLGPPIQALGYEIEASSSVFFAGDTAPFDMCGLAAPDIALLPIAGWGRRLRTEHHLDPRTAAEAAALLRPRAAVPIHWGSLLQMGLERHADELLARPAKEFAAQMAELAPTVEARVLRPGESMPL